MLTIFSQISVQNYAIDINTKEYIMISNAGKQSDFSPLLRRRHLVFSLDPESWSDVFFVKWTRNLTKHRVKKRIFDPNWVNLNWPGFFNPDVFRVYQLVVSRHFEWYLSWWILILNLCTYLELKSYHVSRLIKKMSD